MDVKEKAGEIDERLPYILNALEDARVEKLMIQRFEGLEENMRANIEKIMSKWDEDMPIGSQLLGGMFLVGRGFDVDMLSQDARKILRWLEPLIAQASEAPDSQTVLEISREILKGIDHILKDTPQKNVPGVSDETKRGITAGDFENRDMSDFIREHFEEVKLPTDYDGMADFEHLKDENQAEDETITHPDEGNLAEYNAILTPLRRELNYLVEHLYSLVSKKRQKRRRRAFVRNRERGRVQGATGRR